MATKLSHSNPSSESPAYSGWADPSTEHLWQDARDKLSAGDVLGPQRMIPVIVDSLEAPRLLKQMASLVRCPSVIPVLGLSSDGRETGEAFHICMLSEEAEFRLDGYIQKSEKHLVNIFGAHRYAYPFKENAQVFDKSETPARKSRPILVLSLDGSDEPLQAMQQLQILEQIMNLTEESPIEIGDIFDLIGGVGMSGLVSLLFRYPKSTALNCLSLMEKMPLPPVLLDLPGVEKCIKRGLAKFNDDSRTNDSSDEEGLWASSDSESDGSLHSSSGSTDSIFDKREEEVDLDKPLLKYDIEDRKVFVKANVRDRQEEIFLRTYDGDDPQLISEHISIIDAIKSTLAAFAGPHYEDPKYRGPFGLQSSPYQPDVKWNNPIYDAYREARSVWPDRDIIIVSLGYGRASADHKLGSEQLVERFLRSYPEMAASHNVYRFPPSVDTVDSKPLLKKCAARIAHARSLGLPRSLSEEASASSSLPPRLTENFTK